jgi:hypothetical protein
MKLRGHGLLCNVLSLHRMRASFPPPIANDTSPRR